MPTVERAIDFLESLKAKGRGREVVHVALVEQLQKGRVENAGDKPMTRFCFDTENPETYSGLHAEKDRIIEHVKNRGLAGKLMLRAWREAGPAQIDRWLADDEPGRAETRDTREKAPEPPPEGQKPPQGPLAAKEAPKGQELDPKRQITSQELIDLFNLAKAQRPAKNLDDIEAELKKLAAERGFKSLTKLTRQAYEEICGKLKA